MEKDRVKEIVDENYKNGFHCAETIVNTIYELVGIKSNNESKFATGFCGGIGGCEQEVCGAISGGVIAIGSLYGRTEGGCDISKIINLTTEFRSLFIDRFNTTICKNLIDNLETMPQFNNCKDITAETALILFKLIKAQD